MAGYFKDTVQIILDEHRYKTSTVPPVLIFCTLLGYDCQLLFLMQ